MEQVQDARKLALAKDIAKRSGISEADAQSLIAIAGTDRPALLREARILRAARENFARRGMHTESDRAAP